MASIVPAVRLSLPRHIFPPAPSPGRESQWTGATSAHPDGPRQKLLHIVRHAQGYHNVDPGVMKTAAGFDAQLTPQGRQQCEALQRSTASLRPELYVTSPLTRTVQTALLSFGPQMRAASHAPIIAFEEVRA